MTNYIVDAKFCNDRSITDKKIYNLEYKLNQDIFYSAYIRIYQNSDKVVTLKCSNDIRDQFSTTSSRGNAKLTYPVALITADEVALAGGKYNVKNANYYLQTNEYFWTLTPAFFASPYVHAYVWNVDYLGALNRWNSVSYLMNLRAVINIRSDVLISSGDGTIESPYQLALY